MTTIHAYATTETAGQLSPFEYEVGSLEHDEVEIDVVIVRNLSLRFIND